MIDPLAAPADLPPADGLDRLEPAGLRAADCVALAVFGGESDRITWASDRFLALLGLTPDALDAGIDWVDLTPPEWRAADAHALGRMRRDGSSGPLRKEYLHADGSRVPVLIEAVELEADPFRWVGVAVALESAAHAEAELVADHELAAAHAMLESLVEQAAVGLAFFDAELRCVRTNDAFAWVGGRPAAEHIGRHLRDVVGEVAAADVEPVVRQVLATGVPVTDVALPVAPDGPGAGRELLATYYPVRARGEVTGVGVVVTEVTAERRSERRLRQLIDGLFSFVGLLRPDGVLVEANRAALDAAGLRPEDVFGKRFEDTFWFSHDPAVRSRLAEALERAAAGEPSRYDVDVLVRGGELLPIDFSLVPVVEDGEVVAIIPSAVDVTERRRTEASLQALADLSRALAAAETTEAVTSAILALGPAAVGADFANVGVVEDEALHVVQPGSLAAWIAERYRIVPLRAPTPLADCVTSGQLVEVHGRDAAGGRYEEVVADMWRSGLASLVAVPVLRPDGVALGAMGVAWATPSPLDEATRARLETVVQACGAALDRARRGDQQRAVLDRIQRELLPVVAAPDGLAVAVRYLPATTAIGFGGDWYDLIPLGDGRHVAVIGDVVGHGLAAAARMTQVRGALAALIDAEADLPSIVERATGVLQRMTGERNFIATAALALVDPGAGVVDVVCAGHLPPMLRRPDGGVVCLDGARTPPLGLTGGRVGAQRADFPAGSTLFAYTDGLVERRGESITDGLDRLSCALGTTSFDDAERAVDGLLDAVVEPGDRRDDVAVIALHRTVRV